MRTEPAISAIAANIGALHALVCEAAARTALAEEDLRAGNRMAALGAISGIDLILNDAIALYRATVALHRRRPI